MPKEARGRQLLDASETETEGPEDVKQSPNREGLLGELQDPLELVGFDADMPRSVLD